ncbi:MAG: pimeloyl-ACP methyl ester carboxylesterase [Myxococcota bacterium]|jgi:pimeloyl-ACP methyl ester carboxylesterase
MLLLLLTACLSTAPDTVPANTTDTAPDTTTDTDTVADTGSETSGVDPLYAEGIVLVSVDEEVHAGFGYQIQTYEVTGSYAWPMQTAEGSPPRFRVLSPVVSSSDHPLLVVLHGGAMDVETAASPLGEQRRCTDAHGASYGEQYTTLHEGALLAARLGWVVVVPENSSCDSWVGEGLADPVDPHHSGHVLVRAATDYLRFGQDTVGIDDAQVVVMGHSAGARGATFFASRYPDLAALIVDSGASDMVRFYYDADYSINDIDYMQACFDHNLGGPPYDDRDAGIESVYWPMYEELGLVQALEAQRLSVPIFHVYNSQDGTSPPVQHEPVSLLLAARQARTGARYAEYDADRQLPGHPQLPKSWPPSYAALHFAQGDAVAIVEAESGSGTVGAVGSGVARLGGSVRAAAPSDGPGTLVTLALPVPDEAGTVGLLAILTSDGDTTGEAARVTLSGASRSVEVALSASALPPTVSTIEQAAAFISASRLELDDAGPYTVTVEVTGAADVAADAFIVSWP